MLQFGARNIMATIFSNAGNIVLIDTLPRNTGTTEPASPFRPLTTYPLLSISNGRLMAQ